MRVVVDFQGEGLEFEVPEGQVVARWSGPAGLGPSAAAVAVAEALENPHDFPPFRQMIVPGDRVAIAMDPAIPDAGAVVDAMLAALARSGVEPETVTIVAPSPLPERAAGPSTIEVHDPDDRARIAYLASTRQGRRVYLNRSITDADVVVPVGLLRHEPDGGHRGPWSLLFPGLSDRETIRSMERGRGARPSDLDTARHAARLEESGEVSWLLGSQFHIGIVPGASGLLAAVAGSDAAVRERGIAAVDRHWTLEAPSAAELVVAGVGGPGSPATLDDLAAALETAAGLVRRGGRVVVLSRADGPIGPALRRLADAGDPNRAEEALRGLEDADDYPIALRFARAAAWADLFIASRIDADLLEGLGVAPLERPEQARRLAAGADSVTFLSRAELTRATLLPS